MINITHTHSRSREELRSLLEGLEGDAVERYGIVSRWLGDELRLSRRGLSGNVSMKQDCIEVHLKLNFLLSPVAGRIERGIRAELARRI